MAWEWVGTTVVGVVGIGSTLWAGRRQQQTALQVVRLQVEGQLAATREERRQRRLESAYVELLGFLTSVRRWADTVFPLWGEYTMRDGPQIDASTEGQLTAYWSKEVRTLVEEWNRAGEQFQETALEIARGQEAQKRGQEYAPAKEARLQLEQHRREFARAEERIREQVRAELLG